MKKIILSILISAIAVSFTFGDVVLKEGNSYTDRMPSGESEGIVCFRKYKMVDNYPRRLYGEPWELHPVLVMNISDDVVEIKVNGESIYFVGKKGGEMRINGIMHIVYWNLFDQNDAILLPRMSRNLRHSIFLKFYRSFTDSNETFKYSCTM